MKYALRLPFCFLVLTHTICVFAWQTDSGRIEKGVKVNETCNVNNIHQQSDIIDIGIYLCKPMFKKMPVRGIDTARKDAGKPHVSALPGIGYSLQTGFSAVIQGICGYYVSNDKDANISIIESSISYTQYQQLLIPLQASLWSKGNTYNLLTDWRFLKFPQLTYGLGDFSSLNNAYFIDYSNIRLYTTLYRAVAKDFFGGGGYNMDILWGVHEVNPQSGIKTDFQKYGINSNNIESGVTFNLLYDTRRNGINPLPGSYVNIIYRDNQKLLGSDLNWQSLIMDMRKYIKPSGRNDNILALWGYEWLTLKGNPPYPLLPNIGGDPYANTGRGFNEGRFRGKNMLDFESEYRYGILKNGLINGVLFANIFSFSDRVTNQFSRIYSGYGAGLRIKFNKYSRTNVALDYAFGTDGSKGVFINLGEVF